MTRDYYSDTVQGPRPRTEDTIDVQVWSAIHALLERSIATHALAEDFPLVCDDGGLAYATDRDALMSTIAGEIPDLPSPLVGHILPPTLPVLDLLEFLQRHASKVTRVERHNYFAHDHLRFDRELGSIEMRESINRLLARNGVAYELDPHGRIIRVGAAPVRKLLRQELPPTRDASLDELIELAVERYLDPDPQVRRDGIEKLWDAFERAKTILEGPNKKARAQALLDATASPPAEKELLETEMLALTAIGNTFRIRHHEVDRTDPTDELLDYLYARMLALIYRVHPALR
jgi:hypothetical protein